MRFRIKKSLISILVIVLMLTMGLVCIWKFMMKSDRSQIAPCVCRSRNVCLHSVESRFGESEVIEPLFLYGGIVNAGTPI